LVVALVFGLAVTKVTSYDTWVHLSLGRWMCENGRIPRANLLSYTQPEQPTIDHQWLFQVCLYGMWRTIGIGGATLVKAAIVAAAFALVLATARRKGSGIITACLVALVAAAAARFRFTLRPQVLALLLLSAYLYLLERWRHGRSRGLLLLLPLQVAWANLHGSAILGCGLAVAYAAGESIRAVVALRFHDVSPKPRDRRALALLWGAALALIPITLVNPNGLRLLTLPFTHAAAQSAAGIKELLQDRASIAWTDLGSRHLFFAILAVLGFESVVTSPVRKDVTEAGLFVALLLAAFLSERFVGLFAVAAAPMIARNLTQILGGPLRRMAERLAGGRMLLLHVAAAVALVGLAWLGFQHTRRELPPGLGPAEGLFPEAEINWVQAQYPDGNLFNEFEHGGYIFWRTRRAVFIDSRGLLAYEPGFVRRYVEAWTSRQRWREVTEKHSISVALVARTPLQTMFRTDERWRLRFPGPVCSVFVRRSREKD